jgi:hypothetical protein
MAASVLFAALEASGLRTIFLCRCNHHVFSQFFKMKLVISD